MKRLVLLLTFLVFTIQFLTCSPKNPWENDDNSDDVSSVSAVNNTQVEIVFSSDVEVSSAETIGNYSISAGGSTLAVSNAVRDASDNKIVRLTTDSQDNVEYTLIVTNVTTVASGNVKSKTIDTTNNPDKFTGDGLLTIENVIATSNTNVDIVFSKNIDPVEAEFADNYTIPGLDVYTAEYDSSKTVHLTTSTQSYIDYTLTVSNNIKDTNGDDIESSSNPINFHGYLFCVLSVKSVNNTHVDVEFSNGVNVTSGQIPGNYQVSGGTLNVISALVDSGNNKIVHLTTGSQSAVTYDLEVEDVISISGETVSEISLSFTGDALPEVEGITWISYNKITVIFSEDIETSGAGSKSNYEIVDSATGTISLNITSATVMSGTTVDLETANQSDIEYRITVSNVTDITGNIIDATKNSATFEGMAQPQIINAVWFPNNIVQVIFSKVVNESSALLLANYNISDSLIVNSVSKIDGSTYSLTTDYQNNIEYTVTVSNVTDLAGNIIDPNHNSATFTGNESPAFVSVNRNGTAMLDVYFSENMLDDASIYSPNCNCNYKLWDVTTIRNEVTTIIYNAYLDSSDKSKLHISLFTNLTIGHIYELEINYWVQDVDGNSLRPPNILQFSGPSE